MLRTHVLAAYEEALARGESLSIDQQRQLAAEVRRLLERGGAADLPPRVEPVPEPRASRVAVTAEPRGRSAGGPEVERIREALAVAVDRDGLRPTAREVAARAAGRITPTGLQKFLDGGQPYSRTLMAYRIWYVHQVQGGRIPLDEEAQRVALAVLLADFGPLERQLLVERVKRQYRERGQAPPRWLADEDETS
jgi:hypothetical protein